MRLFSGTMTNFILWKVSLKLLMEERIYSIHQFCLKTRISLVFFFCLVHFSISFIILHKRLDKEFYSIVFWGLFSIFTCSRKPNRLLQRRYEDTIKASNKGAADWLWLFFKFMSLINQEIRKLSLLASTVEAALCPVCIKCV